MDENVDWTDEVRQLLLESARVKQRMADQCAADIVTAAQMISDALQSGGKLLLCGNGGSAADAQHIAAEFVGRLTASLERPALPAIALSTNTSCLTALANDYGFEWVFARQVEALGEPGDVLIAISTSGNSANVLRAVEVARMQGLRTIGLTGEPGGQLAASVDSVLQVPSTDSQRIQEGHITIGHILCALSQRGSRLATSMPTE